MPKPSYDHVILTDEEAHEALRLAREMKEIESTRREYLNNLTREPVFRQYNAVELYQILSTSRNVQGDTITIDGANQDAVDQLCFYFAKDKRFMGDLNKGLLLMGPKGTGKTHLMKFFQQNQVASYIMVNCRIIENAWINEKQTDEVKIIDYYSKNKTLAFNENRFGHMTAGFCFDDLGSETTPSKRFGEEKNVLAEIILNRYDAVTMYQHKYDDEDKPIEDKNRPLFCHSHIVTNILPEDLEQRYGSRMRDRLREMFNLITVEGKSRRV